MIIVGNVFSGIKFKNIYAIFTKKADAISFVKNNIVLKKNDLSIVEIINELPIFIIEEFSNGTSFFIPINKPELQNRISEIKEENIERVYFNLWKIDEDCVNIRFPSEPILNGRKWHLHFTIEEKKSFDKIDFDNYWNKLIKEK